MDSRFRMQHCSMVSCFETEHVVVLPILQGVLWTQLKCRGQQFEFVSHTDIRTLFFFSRVLSFSLILHAFGLCEVGVVKENQQMWRTCQLH